ncbi:sphingomyelin phosphodiesterase 3-like [Acipenser ruthenus]|uniref:sphingomyelin phosphodiesterase 3-like n=1 Tax=Acipenser ruthenus TaxID=7906 RepID=UPI00156116AE|nr:sphingomyelin phosphodiesterase 3-like [Acipenser ruthenus]XP_058849641.1 sphingomyelin phosphodiesterase 3-like [Acipenser ruthenus]
MVLHTSPFSSAFLRFLHSLSWGLIFPCFWLFDRLLASFLATTYEKRQHSEDPCYSRALCILISTPFYLALVVATLPFAFLGFLLWAPLQAVRRPYVYSQRGRVDKNRAEQGNAGTPVNDWRASGKSFCFCSANVCLLPDSLARFNNLSDTQGRAKEVGKRISNGASRPQIKIYIDSPTNTSISAVSFTSLVSPQGGGEVPNKVASVAGGVRSMSLTEYKHESNGEAEKEPEESSSSNLQELEQENTPLNEPDSASGVQISISAPVPSNDQEPEDGQTPNDKPKEGDSGSLDSRTASRDSLVKFHISDSNAVNNKLVYRASMIKKASVRKRRHADDCFDHEISAFFPANLDFLCLQEVFDKRAAEKLKNQLHHYFQHVIYDVGCYAWKGCGPFKFLNSGLLLASRYPILDASYRCFPNGRGEDALAAKGALFVKVHVGSTPQDQRIVGYISGTHLHASAADCVVRCEQLDLLVVWQSEFIKSTSRPAGADSPEDMVAFNVICGDLNFDNCSSEDKLEQQHSLFTRYKDPCRVGPGEDKPWVVGTLLDSSGLYNEEVSSPENLQKIMENEEGRKEYLVYPTNKNHGSNRKGRKIPLKGSGRRIDYILYTEEGLQPEWKVDIEEFSFITQLAGLTDHLPVSMRLAVSTGEEEP